MAVYSVYAQAYCNKYLGEVEANSQQEALTIAENTLMEHCWINTNIHNDFDVGDTEMIVEQA